MNTTTKTANPKRAGSNGATSSSKASFPSLTFTQYQVLKALEVFSGKSISYERLRQLRSGFKRAGVPVAPILSRPEHWLYDTENDAGNVRILFTMLGVKRVFESYGLSVTIAQLKQARSFPRAASEDGK